MHFHTWFCQSLVSHIFICRVHLYRFFVSVAKLSCANYNGHLFDNIVETTNLGHICQDFTGYFWTSTWSKADSAVFTSNVTGELRTNIPWYTTEPDNLIGVDRATIISCYSEKYYDFYVTSSALGFVCMIPLAEIALVWFSFHKL